MRLHKQKFECGWLASHVLEEALLSLVREELAGWWELTDDQIGRKWGEILYDNRFHINRKLRVSALDYMHNNNFYFQTLKESF